MIHALIRFRFVVLGLVVVALGALLLFGKHVRFEQSIQSFFADDDPAVVSYLEGSRTFGNDQIVFVCYDDPDLLTPAGMARVRELAAAIGPERLDGIVHVENLADAPVFWTLDDRLAALDKMPSFARGPLIRAARSALRDGKINEFLPTIGKAVSEAKGRALESLKERIVSHPLLRGTLIDSKGTCVALVARMKSPTEHDVMKTVVALRESADGFAREHGLNPPAIVGPPILLADGFVSIERDGRLLAIVGMGLIGLVTFSVTRSVWWALTPLLAGWTVWLATETILAALDFRLSLSGGPLIAQIIVLTMPAAGHLALHYRDDRRRSADPRAAAVATLSAVSSPILWCALTGALGYGALLTSGVVPIRQFGAILAVCSGAAAILTLSLSPVAMAPPSWWAPRIPLGSESKVAALLRRLTQASIRKPAPIVVGVLIVVAPLLYGMTRLRSESNYINAFKPRSRVVRDYRFVESRLGGIGLATLVTPLEKVDPASLDRFRELERLVGSIRQADGSEAVTRVISPAAVLDPDRKLSASALKTKIELISASPQADLLRGFWNPREHKARTLVRVYERRPATEKLATFRRAEIDARELFGPKAFLTGLSHLLTQTTRGVLATQWTTFLWSTLSISLMLALAFRGPLLAFLAILPTLLSVGFALGLMGWLGIKLDVATALVASVALGLSVDDTFHCLLQFRRRRAEHGFERSILSAYAVSGPGVLLSSLAVAVGFAVLRFSEFVPFSNFGAMVAIATAGSSLGNLVLLPACLSLAERRRLPKKNVPLKESGAPIPAGSS